MNGLLSLQHDIAINSKWLNLSCAHTHMHIRIWIIFNLIVYPLFTGMLEMGHRMVRPWSPLLEPNSPERWFLLSHHSPRWAGAGVAVTMRVVRTGLYHGEKQERCVSVTVWGGVSADRKLDLVDVWGNLCTLWDKILVTQVEPHNDNNNALATRPIFMHGHPFTLLVSPETVWRMQPLTFCHGRAWVLISVSLDICGILSSGQSTQDIARQGQPRDFGMPSMNFGIL